MNIFHFRPIVVTWQCKGCFIVCFSVHYSPIWCDPYWWTDQLTDPYAPLMTCIFTQRHYGPCHAFTFPSLIQIWSTPSVIMNTVESGMSKCAHYICILITKINSVQSYFCYHRLLWLQENMQLSVWKTKTAWYKSKLFKQASLFLSYNALSLHEKRILNATSLWKGLRCNCSWWEAWTARRYADNLKTCAFCVIDSFV